MRLNKKQTVLDERELQVMYRIEHIGLWLMYALLCAAVLVQLFLGADMVQMAGELFVIICVSVVMMIANARHGIWDNTSRPSVRNNAVWAIGAGVCVAAMIALLRGSAAAALAAGLATAALCFLLLTALMAYMLRRQKAQEKALED
ncbi:MAG: hypothetical protein IKK34_06140 [Clostridia bacterium]|nr:hypothetical protein [Clostridia bacterium]